MLDGLRGTELEHVDAFLLETAAGQPRSIREIILRVLGGSRPGIPHVTDLFYTERLSYLLDINELIIVEDNVDWMKVKVTARKQT